MGVEGVPGALSLVLGTEGARDMELPPLSVCIALPLPRAESEEDIADGEDSLQDVVRRKRGVGDERRKRGTYKTLGAPLWK